MRNEQVTMKRQYESDMAVLKEAIATREIEIESELEMPVKSLEQLFRLETALENEGKLRNFVSVNNNFSRIPNYHVILITAAANQVDRE